MNSLLCDSVGYIDRPAGRKWWGGGKVNRVVVFFEIDSEALQEGATSVYEADVTIHAHSPHLGTNCAGKLELLPGDQVKFTSEGEKVRFVGRALSDQAGFEGKISIVGPENLNIEDSPIRFGEIEE